MQDASKTEPLNQSNHWFSIIPSKLSIRGENGPSQDKEYIIQNLHNIIELWLTFKTHTHQIDQNKPPKEKNIERNWLTEDPWWKLLDPDAKITLISKLNKIVYKVHYRVSENIIKF